MTRLSIIVMASFAFFRRDFRKTKCYFLCNPTIKKVRCLPKSILSDSFVGKGAELSYDCNTDDYKFVVFGHNSAFHEPKAEIYSLRNVCWRDISFDRGDMFDYVKRASWYDDPQSIFIYIFLEAHQIVGEFSKLQQTKYSLNQPCNIPRNYSYIRREN